MFILSSLSSGLEFWSLNHTSIYESPESKVFKNIKGAEATKPKILKPYFFYSNFYLIFLRSCCENIIKIVCIISEKTGK